MRSVSACSRSRSKRFGAVRSPSAEAARSAAPLGRRFGAEAQNTLLSIGIVLIWVLWVARAMPGFWLLLVVIVLPLAAHVTRRAVEHLLRPPGTAQVAETAPGVTVVFLERGIRALLIIGAVGTARLGLGRRCRKPRRAGHAADPPRCTAF